MTTNTSPKKSIPKTDASKIRALEEQLAQREVELAVINSIQSALASKMDFQGIIDAVGDKLNEIFVDGNVGIGFIDKARNVVSIPYVIENGKRLEPVEISMDAPSVMQHIIKRRKPVLINSKFQERFGKNDTIMFPGRDQRDLKSWLSVPFFKGDAVIGGMSLRSWDRENAFTEADVRLLQTVANSMIVALENARLLKETEQRATELQIINNIGQTLTEGLDLDSTLERVGDRLRETLKVETIGISVWDEKIEHIIARYFYRNGKPIPGEIWDTSGVKLALRLSARGGGRSWVVTKNVEKAWRKFGGGNEAEIPKSFVQLPLLAGGKFVGGITIADYEREDAFTNISIGMLETIASNLGTAIQNVRLFDETQRLLKETEQRAAELQIINNIGQTLTEGLDLQSTLERVGERLRDTLRVQSIAIAAYDPENNFVLAQYIYHKGQQITSDQFTEEKFKFAIRFAARWAGRSWVATTSEKYLEKYIRKFAILGFPKSFAAFPLLSSGEVIGGITIADDESEDAFTNLPIGMLETISSNMGTAIQNVRLFDETQRLLKETEQRATELQIINNIGQTLTEGLDLNTTLERVGDRLREVLQLTTNTIGIVANDTKTGLVISHYAYLKGKRINLTPSLLGKNLFGIRFAAKVGFRPLVVTTNLEKNWRRFVPDVPEWAEIPKSFVIFPLLSGGELVGSITIADYEKENAFIDLPITMLETIASNMGTAIQNVRLFDETQRLLKETEQRATELQIINNIGQTLTEGLDLNTTLERVGDRLREALDIESLGIIAFDSQKGVAISNYIYHYGRRVNLQSLSMSNYKFSMRFASKVGNKPWVVNANAEKYWEKFVAKIFPDWTEIPKSFVMIPLLAGGELAGCIGLADYKNENAFVNLSINLLETIASNMGTAIQNVRLFDETKRLFEEAEESRASAEQASKLPPPKAVALAECAWKARSFRIGF